MSRKKFPLWIFTFIPKWCILFIMENLIAKRRKEKKLTQEQLADLVGTSKVQISRLENGTRRINSDWLEKISKALGIKETALISEGVDANSNVPTYNKEIISDIFVTVEKWLNANRYDLESEDKISLVFALYDRVADIPKEQRSAQVIYLTDFLYKSGKLA